MKDFNEMDDDELLHALANAVIRYDQITDTFIARLQEEMTKNGIDYEKSRWFPELHMRRDERFCQMREILRIAKNDPKLLQC